MISEIFINGLSLGDVQEAQPGTNGQGQDDAFPIYYASQSDPSYSVTCSKYGGCSNFMPSAVHIPNGARASIDSDHHAVVIELWAGLEIDFWQFNDSGSGSGTTTPVSGGGSLSVGFAGLCNATSLAGHGRCAGGSVAADDPIQPGMIDPREWIKGTINHTIYVAVRCPSSGFLGRLPAATANARLAPWTASESGWT